MFWVRSVAVALSLAVTGVWVWGAETQPSSRPAPAAATSKPTTTTAPTTSPFELEEKARTDIKSAVTRFARAMEKGDIATAKSLSVGNDKEMALVEAMSSGMGAFRKVQEAAVQQFKDAGWGLLQGEGTPADEMVRELDDADILVHEDEADVRSPNARTQPLKMRRVDGRWKLDVHAMAGSMGVEPGIAMFKQMAQAADQTSKEISQGKFKTVEEARAAFSERIRAAVMGTLVKATTQAPSPAASTTKPTTGPATTRP